MEKECRNCRYLKLDEEYDATLCACEDSEEYGAWHDAPEDLSDCCTFYEANNSVSM